MDCMTCGIQAYLNEAKPGFEMVAQFVAIAPTLIRGKEPSMVVGKPGAIGRVVEDNGCTIVVPLPTECPKLYACQNETGGATVMLAEEY